MSNIIDNIAEAFGDKDFGKLEELTAELEGLRDSGEEFHDFDDDFVGIDEPVEFRVYLRPEGNLELCVGDPSYDTDHRGACGTGAVDPSVDSIGDAVLDAVFEAIEDAYSHVE